MLDNLRAAANHIVIKVILALIVFSFVLTGVGNYLIGGNQDYAAKVNGDSVSRWQLEQAFNIERVKQQQMLGESFSELASDENYMSQMRQQVLTQLIDKLLLQQYVNKLHLTVNDSQVEAALFNQPLFQSNGKFDNEKFKRILADAGYSTSSYAEAMREQLVEKQLIDSVVNSEFVLPEEAKQLIQLFEQKRKIRTATIDLAPLIKLQTASSDEMSNYYQQNNKSFTTKEQYRVEYIEFAVNDLKKPVTEKEIESWYEQNKSDYTQPERVRYRVIQTKSEANAQAILQQLSKKADFAVLAKSKSIDPVTSPKGGDLGWLEKSVLPNEIRQANLTKNGELSGVIKSQAGFFIIQLNDQQAAQTKPLKQVYSEIKNKLAQEKAIDDWYKLQQKVRDVAANNNESLADVENVVDKKVITTDWFTQETVPQALNYAQVKKSLFDGSLIEANGKAGINSEVIVTDDNHAFILRISEYKGATIKPFDEVKDIVSDKIKKKKAEKQAETLANKLLTELRSGKMDGLKAINLDFTNARVVTRYQQQPEIQKVFTLSMPQKNKPIYDSIQDTKGNIVLIALDEIINDQIADKELVLATKEILQNDAQLNLVALIQYLRDTAKIKYGSMVR